MTENKTELTMDEIKRAITKIAKTENGVCDILDIIDHSATVCVIYHKKHEKTDTKSIGAFRLLGIINDIFHIVSYK